jgi:predicted Zn finger-like uncharacterized protein
MALATQCPHCGKRFRVAADQLKLRGGIVRCGACNEIFDGNAALIDLDALAASAPTPSGRQPAPSAPGASAGPVVPAQDAAPPAVTPVAPTDTQSMPAPAAAQEPEAGTDPASVAPGDADLDDEPIYTLDFDHTFDPFGILPKPASDDALPAAPHALAEPEALPEPEPEPGAAALPAHPEPEPEPEPESKPAEPKAPQAALAEPVPAAPAAPGIDPTLGLPVDEELVAAPLPGADDPAQPELAGPAPHAAAAPPLPMRESAPTDPLAPSTPPRAPLRPKVAERAARRSKLTPTRIAPPKLRVAEIDEPEFVRRGRQQEQSGRMRRIAMLAGSVLLLLVLAAQGVFTFRDVLAARYPSAKPALAATCAVFGCRVELPARIENLTIEQGELGALGGNAYSLSTLLHNQGSLALAWPRIELTLTDTNDKPLLRRVFAPGEYLPQGATAATGFAARAEQPVKLVFQLDQLKPSGYRISVFYP